MKVVAFNGSPRKNGNTALMLTTVLEHLNGEGIETELVQVGGRNIHGCIACFKCKETKNGKCAIETDMLNECVEKMVAADGILLGSPVYFANLTPEIKALIDRSGYVCRANGGLLKYKVGAGVAAARRAGAVTTFDALNHFFTISEMFIPGADYWNIGFGLQEKDVQKDDEGIKTMQSLGRNMAWLLKKITAE